MSASEEGSDIATVMREHVIRGRRTFRCEASGVYTDRGQEVALCILTAFLDRGFAAEAFATEWDLVAELSPRPADDGPGRAKDAPHPGGMARALDDATREVASDALVKFAAAVYRGAIEDAAKLLHARRDRLRGGAADFDDDADLADLADECDRCANEVLTLTED